MYATECEFCQQSLVGWVIEQVFWLLADDQSNAHLDSISPAFLAVQEGWTLALLPLLTLPTISHALHMLPELEDLTKAASVFQA